MNNTVKIIAGIAGGAALFGIGTATGIAGSKPAEPSPAPTVTATAVSTVTATPPAPKAKTPQECKDALSAANEVILMSADAIEIHGDHLLSDMALFEDITSESAWQTYTDATVEQSERMEVLSHDIGPTADSYRNLANKCLNG